jgi:hypothetical protein
LTPKEFITKKIREISEEGIQNFPDDFLFPCETDTTTLPSGSLLIGNEFFGSYEVLTVNGDSFCHTDTLLKAKYYVYASRKKERNIKIPVNGKDIETVVKNYEKYLDKLLKQIENDYRSLNPEYKDVNSVVNEVFRLLNLKRL